MAPSPTTATGTAGATETAEMRGTAATVGTGKTTTLRVPRDLRDEIARLAERRDTTMVEVVTDAVARLGREEWWASVQDALDELSTAEVTTYAAESRGLAGAAADGLDGR